MGDLSWRFDDREYNYIKEVLDSGFASSTSGNMNARLEEAFAKRFNQRFAITSSNGTTTLHSALLAFGVGYGDEVITTPLTVIACMNAILYCNAIPVFADVDPDTFLIDPNSIRKNITERTKAIMPVHLYGQVCDMTEIMNIAEEFNLKVIEDCAQCYLGTHKGKIGGTIGHAGSWSFENSKHLTTGDGGIVTCDDEDTADLIRKIGVLGFRNGTAKSGKIRVSKNTFQDPDYKRHSHYGYNFRMPEVAAAMGLAQLEKIDMFVGKRIQMLNMYKDVTQNFDWINSQFTHDGDINSAYSYAARLNTSKIKWKDFRNKMLEHGGDGVFAAWALQYKEDSMPKILHMLETMGLKDRMNIEKINCPNAETIQPEILQFTTNQKNEEEMKIQADALFKTLKYFD